METVCKSVGDSCDICIYASSTSSQKSAANTGKLLDVHVQPANQGCGELAEVSNKTDSLYEVMHCLLQWTRLFNTKDRQQRSGNRNS